MFPSNFTEVQVFLLAFPPSLVCCLLVPIGLLQLQPSLPHSNQQEKEEGEKAFLLQFTDLR